MHSEIYGMLTNHQTHLAPRPVYHFHHVSLQQCPFLTSGVSGSGGEELLRNIPREIYTIRIDNSFVVSL